MDLFPNLSTTNPLTDVEQESGTVAVVQSCNWKVGKSTWQSIGYLHP